MNPRLAQNGPAVISKQVSKSNLLGIQFSTSNIEKRQRRIAPQQASLAPCYDTQHAFSDRGYDSTAALFVVMTQVGMFAHLREN